MPQPQTEPPRAYESFKDSYPSVGTAYEQLGEACHVAGPLDWKTRELAKLGIAIGAGLESAAHAHVRLALEAGAEADELRHVAVLATTTVGFPSARRALAWIDDVLANEREAIACVS